MTRNHHGDLDPTVPKSSVDAIGYSPARERRDRTWAPRFVRRSRPLRLTWQVVVFFVGVGVIVTGIVLLFLPVFPGWAAIFVGLAVLATEFAWAERILDWSKRQAAKAKQRALDLSKRWNKAS